LVRRQEVASGAAAKLILAVSSNSVREICRDLRIAEDKVRVLPVPVDLDQLQPGQPRTDPSRYILSVGRLDRRKDFPTLLKAFQEVAGTMDGVQLHIVGDGRERKNLERMTMDLGIQDRVDFLGQVGNRELIQEYRSASCFALASRQEGLGIVFLEAMASGLPVVATDSGGSSDPIVHGGTGYLVPVGDWKGLAEHMTRLFRDPDVMVKLGQAGHERALSTYSFDKIFSELDKAYAEVFNI
jgi:glycosyltransferase involved in cell wall biosynthesis